MDKFRNNNKKNAFLYFQQNILAASFIFNVTKQSFEESQYCIKLGCF